MLVTTAPPRWGSQRGLIAGVAAQPVKLTLGPLGATAELITLLLQDPGPGLQGIAWLFALAGATSRGGCFLPSGGGPPDA